jgi:hypothetical protein
MNKYMKKSTPDITKITLESFSEKTGSVREKWRQEICHAQHALIATPHQDH